MSIIAVVELSVSVMLCELSEKPVFQGCSLSCDFNWTDKELNIANACLVNKTSQKIKNISNGTCRNEKKNFFIWIVMFN